MFVLCYALCFLFFKQKTAYEMRISDWSSDVCSSDLPEMVRRLHSDVIALKPDLVLWQLGTNAVLRSEGVDHLQALAARTVTMLHEAGIDVVLEIGRASCRERVCPSV